MGAVAHEDFRRAVDGPDEHIDLGRAALTIAAGEYPGLDIGAYLARIDRLAAAVTQGLGARPDARRSIAALNVVLFQEQGFRGNRDDYYDPKNSFLNEVIDRKTGIPIALSVLYMEVARRIGLALDGVGFPGHFMVKYSKEREEIVIDPFNDGAIKPRESLEKLLGDLSGGRMVFRADLLRPVTKKQILKRMLNNLKMIYFRNNEWLPALSAVERLVILEPQLPEDVRDRGIIYMKLECFRLALDDFENYLRLAPDAEDVVAVREQVVGLARQVRQIQ